MCGGIANKSARDVLFVVDCDQLEEATRQEGAKLLGVVTRRLGDQSSIGLDEELKVLLKIVEGCKGP